MFPRLLSLFVLALTSLSSLAVEEMVSIQYESNKSMCLGVPPGNGSIADNSELAIYPCIPGDLTQSWKLAGNVIVQVVLNNTFCIDINVEPPPSPHHINGAQLIIKTCETASGQQLWQYESEKMHFSYQDFDINNHLDPGPHCMSLENGNIITNKSVTQDITTSKVQLAKCNDSDSKQKWVLTNVTMSR